MGKITEILPTLFYKCSLISDITPPNVNSAIETVKLYYIMYA